MKFARLSFMVDIENLEYKFNYADFMLKDKIINIEI